ncbi:SH3 domain-containing protein [Romboutsia hominis]|uniref:SH3 domain-containing protein n=4 Tax=Romboutsia TaxID=1501226 RepID=UPI001F051E45|nr:SH3 domain-containing protein [Romboutsia hominis]MCH1960832.1 SH3 domain-containing protein [Romboutsia hominis]MCH1968734.1 SH3 domain-containing protein [Romboutsia hominis]
MKEKIALAALAAVPMTVSSVYASDLTGIVTTSYLNVRSGPSTSHAVIFSVKKDEKVSIEEQTDGWYKIKTNTGNTGWASSTYISLSNNESNDNPSSDNQRRVTIEGLNMRNGAGTSYRAITKLKNGTILELISENNGWSKVKYDGRIGYVYSDYLEKVSDSNINTRANTTKVVNYDFLNVRSGPSTSHSIVGKLNRGDKVGVISESNGWSKINYNGKVSYVSSRYLSNPSNTNPEKPDSNNESVKETKVVNYEFLNVRSGPSTSHSKIGTLKKGDKVGVISESNGWSKIKYNGNIAYVSSTYLSKENTTPEAPSNPGESIKETKVVNYEFLNVRSGPSTSHSKIGTLKKGDKVGVISESNGWSKIKYNGKVAYVSSTYLSKENTTPEVPSNPGESIKETKVVNYEFLNVRSGPSTSHSKIGTLKKGDKVGVISESNGWSKIKYNGNVAYVSSSYLSSESTTPEVPSNPDNHTVKVVNYDFLNVRSGPSTSHSKIGVLSKGDEVKVKEESNGWSKIDYRGSNAYVSSMYLSNIGSSGGSETPDNGGGTANINGATVNHIQLGYTLEDHVVVQLERARVGGNVIDSSIKRGFVTASRADLEYYLNPNNFTGSTKGMMQFLRTDSYKGGVTASELNSYLNSLRPASSGTNVFYNQGQTFINAAKRYDIDLAYLVSHAMWETAYGRSTLAQGQTITSYKGKPLPSPVKVYNFFGIGAIDHSANVSGAEAAYSNGWTSVEATIDGSAKWIAQNYIKNTKYKQNNIFKMKFNYDYSWHQYATDVNWANGISGVMVKIVGMYDKGSNLVFDIPKYSR